MTTNCTSELVNQPDVGIINTNGRLLNAQPLNGDKGERRGNFFSPLFFFPFTFFFCLSFIVDRAYRRLFLIVPPTIEGIEGIFLEKEIVNVLSRIL